MLVNKRNPHYQTGLYFLLLLLDREFRVFRKDDRYFSERKLQVLTPFFELINLLRGRSPESLFLKPQGQHFFPVEFFCSPEFYLSLIGNYLFLILH